MKKGVLSILKLIGLGLFIFLFIVYQMVFSDLIDNYILVYLPLLFGFGVLSYLIVQYLKNTRNYIENGQLAVACNRVKKLRFIRFVYVSFSIRIILNAIKNNRNEIMKDMVDNPYWGNYIIWKFFLESIYYALIDDMVTYNATTKQLKEVEILSKLDKLHLQLVQISDYIQDGKINDSTYTNNIANLEVVRSFDDLDVILRKLLLVEEETF